jgi:hypothetical protein
MGGLFIAVIALGASLVVSGLAWGRRLRRSEREEPLVGLEGEPMEPIELAVDYRAAPVLRLGDVEYGQAYRRKDDPAHVVRFRSQQPRGFRRKIAEYVPVVGISREQRPVHAARLIAGRDPRLELEPAPDALPDHPEAIRVWGLWIDADGQLQREELGRVPDDVAAQIASQPGVHELAAVPRALFMPVDGRSPGVRMDIWTDARRRSAG